MIQQSFRDPSEDPSPHPVEVTNLSRSQVTNLSRSELTYLSGSDKTCLNPKGSSDSRVYEDPKVSELLLFVADDELEIYLQRAVNADKSKNRVPIKPPCRAGMAAYAKRKQGKALKTYSRLASCLRAVAVRALWDLTADGRFAPDHAQLANVLEGFAWENYRHVIHVQEYGEPRDGGARGWSFTDEDGVTSAARQAAEEALGTLSWSPEGRAELKRREQVGGAKSRRGPTKATAENLARLIALPDGMTVKQQAKRLHLKEATVKRLRRFPK